jgi:hypothetical protein
MRDAFITAHVRKILDRLARDHRTAHQELREGMAALAAAAAKGKLQKDGTRIHEL